MNYRDLIILFSATMLLSCAVNDIRKSQGHIEALTVADMGFFKVADSISYKGQDPAVSNLDVNGLSKISEIEGKTELTIYVNPESLVCAEKKGVEISSFIRNTMPKNSWYQPLKSQTVELVLTKVRNFKIRNYFLTTPRFYVNFDPCGDRSKIAIQKRLLMSLETVFHELSHIRINSEGLFVNGISLKQEETYASSIGLCATLLSPYVKEYKLNTEFDKNIEFYKSNFVEDDPRYISAYGSLKAQKLFSEALGVGKSTLDTDKYKNDITKYCNTIFLSAY